jgi:Tol biopolymer transport system component
MRGTSCAFVAALGVMMVGTAGAQVTRRISVSSSGQQGNDLSTPGTYRVTSADGRYIVFDSYATNLAPGATNGFRQIYLKDRLSGKLTLVSASAAGVQGNDFSGEGSISADGRFVAFDSRASNLVPGDTNGSVDVFVYDRVSEAITRVSVKTGGAQAFGDSEVGMGAALSRDGRFVVFASSAPDLVPGDSNGSTDVFVHDRQTGTTTRVSTSESGGQGNGYSSWACISDDGRFVAFESGASNLTPEDTNFALDVLWRDRDADGDGVFDETHAGAVRVRLASRSDAGAAGNGHSVLGVISTDGRYVGFQSEASNLVPGDSNDLLDTFVRDMTLLQISRTSVSSSGAQLDGESRWSALHDRSQSDAEAFCTKSGDVIPGVPPPPLGAHHLYVRRSGVLYHASPHSAGTGYGASYPGSLTADGRTVAYLSYDGNLVSGDTNGEADVFIRSIGPDGHADWELLPLAVQNTQTSLGDSTSGDTMLSDGAELDAAYGYVDNRYLHLTLAGNLRFETSIANELLVFIDCQPGGQNTILPNSHWKFSQYAGLRFDPGFEPDFAIMFTTVSLWPTLDIAELPTGVGASVRHLGDPDIGDNWPGGAGELIGDNGEGFLATLLNSNTLGVTAGTGASSGSGVRSGLELAIPLASIGNPSCGIRCSALIARDAVISNQVLGPIGGGAALGPAANVNLANVPGQQFFSITPSLDSYTNIKAPSPQLDAQFGRGIALRSGKMLIGARRLDRTGANDSGAIFTSEQSAGVWSPALQVTPSTLPAAGDRLGWSVGMDQNWAFVGAPNRDSAGNDAGAVWVFERTGGNTWTQRAILTAPDAQAGANFGYSVDLVFDTAIVGAPNHDAAGTDSGKAYVYQRSGSTWNLVGQFAPSDGAAGDQFGFDVGLSQAGTDAVIGAPGDDRTGLTDAGAAYIYRRLSGTWPNTVTRRLEATGAVNGERLGTAVVVTNSYAAAGAPSVGTGQVRTFTKGNSTWTTVTEGTIAPADGEAGDLFGSALAATGSLLAVGSPDSGTPFFDSGAIYVYGSSSGFVLQSRVAAPDASAGDALGGDVAIDGLTLAAGAGGFDIGGTAYAFNLATAGPVIASSPPDAEYPEGTEVLLEWPLYFPTDGTVRFLYEGVEWASLEAEPGALTVSFFFFLAPEYAGTYRIEAVTACGSALSDPTTITITPCPADFDGTGFVDTDDFDAFVAAFELGLDEADFDGSGFTDTDDFDAFVHAFELGC